MSTRSRVVTVKLTEIEFRQVEEESAAQGISKAEMFREAWYRDTDQLHALKAMDDRLKRLETNIGALLSDKSYFDPKFDELAKRDRAMYRAIKELVAIALEQEGDNEA